MNDLRKRYIYSLITNYFRIQDNSYAEYVDKSTEVNEFLDNPNCQTLITKFDTKGPNKILQVYNTLDIPNFNTRCLVFIKLQRTLLSSENIINNVIITTSIESIIDTLHHLLNVIYIPFLQTSNDDTINCRLSKQLLELDSTLGNSSLRFNSLNNADTFSVENDNDSQSLSFIISPRDEMLYWSAVLKNSNSLESRERAQFFQESFSKIYQVYFKLESIRLSDYTDIIDILHDLLDDLWRQSNVTPPYPELRMRHMFECCSNMIHTSIYSYLKSNLPTNGIPIFDVSSLLQSVSIFEKWLESCEILSNQLWRKFLPHPWLGPAINCNNIEQFVRRIEDLININTIYSHLASILTSDEQKEVDLQRIWINFNGTNPLNQNPFTESIWNSSISNFYQEISLAERKVAMKLRLKFRSMKGSPGQLMNEVLLFKDLIKREIIRQELTSEREILLGQVTNLVESLQKDFSNRFTNKKVNLENNEKSSSKTFCGSNIPSVIENIIWVRRVLFHLNKLVQVSDDILFDLSTYSTLKQSYYSLNEKLTNCQQTLIDDWCNDISTMIDIPEEGLNLESHTSVLELDNTSGRVYSTYPDKLVQMLREVRRLSSLGVLIPSKIQRIATNAEKFLQYGTQLKQIASFYNTIDKQIIPSQQPLLIATAKAFERILLEQNIKSDSSLNIKKFRINWNNPKQLELYIYNLQKAAEAFSNENRILRKCHSKLIHIVSELFDLDLIQNQRTWKQRVVEIREIIQSLIDEQHYNLEHAKAWKIHWNYQLYKALECCYRSGIYSLNKNMSEIKVELILKNNEISFKPPFEEIKSKYYKNIRNYVSIPSTFRGIDNIENFNSNFFSSIIENNSKNLHYIYSNAKLVFKRLLQSKAQLEPWICLTSIDLEDFVIKYCKNVNDFEFNFKLLKNKGKELEQLPNLIKIECISLSCFTIKSSIGHLIQNLHDALIFGLQQVIKNNISKVDKFMSTSNEKLSLKPQSLSEITDCREFHTNFNAQRVSIEPLFSEISSYCKLLRMVEGVSENEQLHTFQNRISELHSFWDQLTVLSEAHDVMINEQLNVLKGFTEGKIANLNHQLEKFNCRWKELKSNQSLFCGNLINLQRGLNAYDSFYQSISEFRPFIESSKTLLVECEQFLLPKPEFSHLFQLENEIQILEMFCGFWKTYADELNNFANEDWISFRFKINLFVEFLNKWLATFRQESFCETELFSTQIVYDIELYIRLIPALRLIIGECFTSEHWCEVFKFVQTDKKLTLENIMFGDLLCSQENLSFNIGSIKDINSRARGEITIREAMNELDMWGTSTVFSLTNYEPINGSIVKIIKDWKCLFEAIFDNQNLLQSLKDSVYFERFKDKTSIWETRLMKLDSCLNLLNQVQRKWIYLEPVFCKNAIPSEQSRFMNTDKAFRSLLKDIEIDNHVLSFINVKDCEKSLGIFLKNLISCQKALNDYLESKRNLFSRFYFIGDEDLLEILGQSTNAKVVNSHLKKIFAGINSVTFSEDLSSIISFHSLEGEVVSLIHPVIVSHNIEEWLSLLSQTMEKSLNQLLIDCIDIYSKMVNTSPDPEKFPSQILCLSESIMFTMLCEKAIKSFKVNELLIEVEVQLKQYSNVNIDMSKSASFQILELKRKALIVDCVRHLHILQLLNEYKIHSLKDWIWQKQLRFYLDKKDCYAQMVDSILTYSYEYQGNAPKLVYTSLTDKCFLTLTQALLMGLGGNPYGPAGTGKTESVKALGILLGRFVLVFNCDEGIDVKSMNRIFIGLIQCGAWGCFDEFNRLEESVLSAISMQIQLIQIAIKGRESTVKLFDSEVVLNHNSGIFITLNPAGLGYGGRQKLPDNLKLLFRPVAMAKPDANQIAEVILYSEGFNQAKMLASKVVNLFTLSHDLLSHQNHYDWGLRAIKTIIIGASNAYNIEKHKLQDLDKESLNRLEVQLIVRTLRLNVLSKLTFADRNRFNTLMNDVFANLVLETISHVELESVLKEITSQLDYKLVPCQLLKCIELHEQLKLRIGVVIVGPSGSGKTTILRLLESALKNLGQELLVYRINPKALSRQNLLGKLDQDTREWIDGVLTKTSRFVVNENSNFYSWIICDGDIDPEWIESLNSVLDDNRILTLPSGERIQFGRNVNFLFETHDLHNASPATISRLGMIFMNEEDVDDKALIKKWLNLHLNSDDNKQILLDLVDTYFIKALQLVLQSRDFVIHCSRIGIILNGLSHIPSSTNKEDFAIAIIRGLTSNLNCKSRAMIGKEISKMMSLNIPSSSNIQDAYYDYNSRKLIFYETDSGFVGNEEFYFLNAEFKKHLPLIKTAYIKRNIDSFINWVVGHFKPHFILSGPEGCGKDTMLIYCFKQLLSTTILTIHCNSETTPRQLMLKIFNACILNNTSFGKVYRPKSNGRLILYIKSLNTPKPDKWGTVQFISFLQQLATYNGFYDMNLEWVTIENFQIVATLTPILTLGRHKLSTRLTSIFCICNIEEPDQHNLHLIYSSLLFPIMNYFSQRSTNSEFTPSTKFVQSISDFMVSLYRKLKQKFSRDKYPYYIITLRNLSEWIKQLTRYTFSPLLFTKENLLKIIIFEAKRIFRDRLVGESSHLDFDSCMTALFREKFIADFDNNENIYFSSFQNNSKSIDSFYGSPLSFISKNDLNDFVVNILELDSELSNIFLLEEVFEYIVRFDRILSKPCGSLILYGRCGVGRHTALRLMSLLRNIQLFLPKISRDCEIKRLKQDIKSALQQCVMEKQEVLFIVEQYQLLTPSFLEILNSLLSLGDINDILTDEELGLILSTLGEGLTENNGRSDLLELFYEIVQRNLHIAILLEVDTLSNISKFECNPALITHCSFQSIDYWSKESMIRFPNEIFKSFTFHSTNLFDPNEFPEMLFSLQEAFSTSFPSILSYQYLIKLFAHIFENEYNKYSTEKARLNAGIGKLNAAANQVSKLKEEANVQRKQLEKKQSEADKSLESISTKMQNASHQKTEMEMLSLKQNEEKMNLENRKKVIEIELSNVIPLLEESKSSVSSIKSESLAEIRALRAPPEIIRDILEGVLRIMGVYDTSWNSMKAFLSKRGIKDEICQLDARNITLEVRKDVQSFIELKSNSFDPHTARRASITAASLAKWLLSIIKYSYVLDKITPLEKEQDVLYQNIKNSEKRMVQLVDAITIIDREVLEMKSKFEISTAEAAKLKNKLDSVENTISAATNLVEKLENEYKRWSDKVSLLNNSFSDLAKRSALSAAFILFLGALEEGERYKKISQLCGMFKLQDHSTITFLEMERQQLQWINESLPSDNLSIENAIIISKTLLSPLIIDPSNKALNWLRNHFSREKFEETNIRDSKFFTKLELSVRFGKTILISGANYIPPILYPLIRNQIFSKSSRQFCFIGEKQVDFNEDFRMIFISNDTLINIEEDCAPWLTFVNFTITKSSLTSQLLTLILYKENPDIENRKNELLLQENQMKLELETTEEFLLQTLVSTEGNIIDNMLILNSLQEIKLKAIGLSSSLKESQFLQESIDKERNVYLSFAEKASNMYFSLQPLSKLNHMYRYNLSSFITIYNRAINSPNDEKDQESKLYLFYSYLQSIFLNTISRSLFQKDRLAFLLNFVHALYPDLFLDGEWEFLCGNKHFIEDLSIDMQPKKEFQYPNWISKDRYKDLLSLQKFFPSLFSSLDINNQEIWDTFCKSFHCEQDLPSIVTKRLTLFQQVLLIKTLSPDRLEASVTNFCSKVLGSKDFTKMHLTLRSVHDEDMSPSQPIIFLNSNGSDPSQEIKDLANSIIGNENFYEIPMGQGQFNLAIIQMKECASKGSWLCLKNLHLVTSSIKELYQEFLGLNPHAKFRFFITTEAHPNFSCNFLQDSLKISYESPTGIKNSMIMIYNQWTSEYLGKGTPLRAQILFVLSWFHSLIKERLQFIPRGWTQFYEFSNSDLRAGASIIDRLFSSNDIATDGNITWWKIIIGLFKNVIYGGRIDNSIDLDVLSSYLSSLFSVKVLRGEAKLSFIKSIPNSNNINDFIGVISNFPNEEQPFIVGMSNNEDKFNQLNKSHLLLQKINNLLRHELSSEKIDLVKINNELTPIFQIWKRLNNEGDLISRDMKNYLNNTDNNPLNDFIFLESHKVIQLIQLIHNNLLYLKQVINGTNLISSQFLDISNSLLKNNIPTHWLEVWDGADDPKIYLRCVVKKAFALDKWVNLAKQNLLQREELDISELLNPNSFLQSFRQFTSRQAKLNIDELKFICNWKNDDMTSNLETLSLRVKGIYIEGCLFDGNQITNSRFDSPIINPLPLCTISWVSKFFPLKYLNKDCVSLPLYASSQRNHLIINIEVPCKGNKDLWIQSGSAFVIKQY